MGNKSLVWKKNRKIAIGVLTAALLTQKLGPAKAEDSANILPISAYQRAEAVGARDIASKALNLIISPVWLPDGERFWFREEAADDWTYVAVDPTSRARRAAFDHGRLAAAIARTTGTTVPAHRLPLTNLTVLDVQGTTVSFDWGKSRLTCNVLAATCAAAEIPARVPYAIVSPDGRRAVLAKENNLWLRDLATGKERPLTSDGEVHFAYGKMPDAMLVAVLQATTGAKFPPYGVEWSPDSRKLVVTRIDERPLDEYDFLQLVPHDGSRRPKRVTIRTRLIAEAARAVAETSIIDPDRGVIRKLQTGPEELATPHWWAPDASHFLALQAVDDRSISLVKVDLATGTVHAVLQETNETFLQQSPLVYDEPAIRYLPATNEIIWFSQRDGWGHLYVIDAKTGAVRAKLGEGDWSVQNIVKVDEGTRRIYFTAVGREKGENPYFRHLYSIGLDGKDMRVLTPEPADHVFPPDPIALFIALGFGSASPALFSPSGRYFIDTWSTVNTAPVSVLRTSDGRIVMPLVMADISAVLKTGWSLPEPFTVKAADGTTDLHGIIIYPPIFDPLLRYPVIDAIYNGPQVVTTPHHFAATFEWVAPLAQSMAQLGFVVVVMDSRGTPLRSKAFQDYIYNNLGEFGLEDHVAGLKSLAASRPYMDIGRIGVFGHSFGGYAAMKAILGYPDVFKAAVTFSGPYDMFGMYSLDGYFAPAKFKDGSSSRDGPLDHPTNWGAVDLTQQADRLKGKLMIVYGDLDENAYPATTVQMVDALIRANKEFDLLYMPNRSHDLSEPYAVRRTWDFFVRNLLEMEPPENYEFGMSIPVSPDVGLRSEK